MSQRSIVNFFSIFRVDDQKYHHVSSTTVILHQRKPKIAQPLLAITDYRG